MKKKKTQKTNAMRVLENHKIKYDVHEYAWNEEHTDAKTAAEKVSIPFEKIYKTLVAAGNNTGVIAACIPASKELDLKKFAKASGNKKVDMLHIKDLEKTTGYIRGGCSPVGMKKKYPTFIDETALLCDRIYVSAGQRGLQLIISPDDLIDFTESVACELIR